MSWKTMQTELQNLEPMKDWTNMNKLKFNPDEYEIIWEGG